MDSLSIPASRLEILVRSVEVASYLPGRIRMYSKRLVGNPGLAREVERELGAFPEIGAVAASTETGSILVQYEPEILRRNEELRRVEAYLMAHARRK